MVALLGLSCLAVPTVAWACQGSSVARARNDVANSTLSGGPSRSGRRRGAGAGCWGRSAPGVSQLGGRVRLPVPGCDVPRWPIVEPASAGRLRVLGFSHRREGRQVGVAIFPWLATNPGRRHQPPPAELCRLPGIGVVVAAGFQPPDLPARGTGGGATWCGAANLLPVFSAKRRILFQPRADCVVRCPFRSVRRPLSPNRLVPVGIIDRRRTGHGRSYSALHRISAADPLHYRTSAAGRPASLFADTAGHSGRIAISRRIAALR